MADEYECEDWEGRVCRDCEWFHWKANLRIDGCYPDNLLPVYECLDDKSDFAGVMLFRDKDACCRFRPKD